MCYHFLYISADLREKVLEPDTSEHCETAGTS